MATNNQLVIQKNLSHVENCYLKLCTIADLQEQKKRSSTLADCINYLSQEFSDQPELEHENIKSLQRPLSPELKPLKNSINIMDFESEFPELYEFKDLVNGHLPCSLDDVGAKLDQPKTWPKRWRDNAEKKYPTDNAPDGYPFHSIGRFIIWIVLFFIFVLMIMPFMNTIMKDPTGNGIFLSLLPLALSIVGTVIISKYLNHRYINNWMNERLEKQKAYCKRFFDAASRELKQLDARINEDNKNINEENSKIKVDTAKLNIKRAKQSKECEKNLKANALLYTQQINQLNKALSVVNKNINALDNEHKKLIKELQTGTPEFPLRHDSRPLDVDYWVTVYDNLNTGASKTWGDALLQVHKEDLNKKNTASINANIKKQFSKLTHVIVDINHMRTEQLNSIEHDIIANNNKNFNNLRQSVNEVNFAVNQGNDLIKTANNNLKKLKGSINNMNANVNGHLDALRVEQLSGIDAIDNLNKTSVEVGNSIQSNINGLRK